MAEIHWANPSNGDFSDPKRWIGKTAPGPGDDAILDASGGFYGVGVTQNVTVNSIQLNADSDLLIDSGVTFTAAQGTGAGADDGQIAVSAGATFAVGGMMNITGEITLGSGGAGKANIATLLIQSSTTLSGGGAVGLSLYAGNHVKGVTTNKTRLVNLDDIIEGSGTIGGGKLTFINDAGGRVIENGLAPLIIDTADRAVINNGSIESQNSFGVLTIQSPLQNNGKISASRGTLTVDGAVTGRGSADIENGATLDLMSSFNQDVGFGNNHGTLVLSQSQVYTATISRFSSFNQTSLDLVDIGFVSASEASFSGIRAGGVLSVSDGTHTASIHLKGNYLTDIFTASSDGHGGTIVVGRREAPGEPPHAFISAMASLSASPVDAPHRGERSSAQEPLLFAPRAATA